MKYTGTGASPARCIGRVLIVEDIEQDIPEKCIREEQAGPEWERYLGVVQELEQEYTRLAGDKEKLGKNDQAKIILAHRSMLKDRMLEKDIRKLITGDCLDAPSSVQKATRRYIEKLQAVDNPYIQERIADLKDVANKIICRLTGKQTLDLSGLDSPTILVGKDIPPSVMNMADPQWVKGIVTETGSRTSHTAILAAGMGIGAVVGCEGCLALPQGSEVFLCGDTGTVEWLQQEPQRQQAEKMLKEYQGQQELLAPYAQKATLTKDGTEILLCANIMDAGCPPFMTRQNPDGVGLFRTEFLFMERQAAPSEAEQYGAYRRVANKMYPRPVIIRTMDIGGDKKAPCLSLPPEENPFLGHRAIRISLERPELFKEQLKAVLRANEQGNLMLMYPMISTLDELLQAKALCEEAKQELEEQGITPLPVKQGIMVETPSAAVMANVLIQHCDFFSIGSNDLTQYTLAADRMNPKVSHLSTHYQPSLLHLINHTAQAAQQAQKLCGVCGEMASDPLVVPLLIGMGIQELSVGVSSLLSTRRLISMVDRKDSARLADTVLQAQTAGEVKQILENHNKTISQ